ncbi:SDR family NAD(P)-dependent oxidoreductase [Telmatospirillum siberiense]|uniref:Short-chain dehydrogenase n=1 Tax=Telmatospirillum siberiense TaxID=382514 RepID=A0A2N3PPT7_9PROT|nr:SDR family oxidoreductase [Telmatospirillum siberiense]PKU22422.1 short-chain dehydrogenase [Telmatospirillum siberiense]
MSALAGKIACVTGATSGLGRQIALALAENGADVAIVGRDAERARETAGAIGKLGRDGLVCLADVTDEGQMAHAAELARQHFGRIDILVCAAGGSPPRKAVWDCGTADYRACFDGNVLGVLLSMKAVLPIMKAQGSGRIINIGGTYGHKGVAGFSLYAAAKWALRGLTKSTALEVAAGNVTVNLISPGGIEGEKLTRQFEDSAARQGLSYDDVFHRFVSQSALGRLSTGTDIANAVLFLASDGGRMVTGQDIVIDGGTIL